MATGYTADIAKGITFDAFAMRCARAFMPLISMRDLPIDAEIPEAFVASSYSQEKAETLSLEIARVQAMTDVEAWAAGKAAAEAIHAERINAREERGELKKKYEAMLAKVMAWTPPTPEHLGVKDFMEKQLRESISFDCRDEEVPPVPAVSGPGWKADVLERLNRELAYYSKAAREEIERVAWRNQWLKDLRESVKPKQETA